MNKMLENFWEWAGISPEEYARNGMDYRSEKQEFYYPQFEQLLAYTEEIIAKKYPTNEEIEDLLTIMALDNETENVLNILEEKLTEDSLICVIETGLYHLQPNARWQLSELIYRRRPTQCFKYLNQLATDSHYYVKQRAKNVLTYLKTGDGSISSDDDQQN